MAKRLRVLIVDDEEMVGNVLRLFLEMRGHECEMSEESTAALQKHQDALASNRRFDLIITDLNLYDADGINGIQLAARFKKQDAHAVIIACSGSGIREGMSDDFSHFLQKPIVLETLRSVLDRYEA